MSERKLQEAIERVLELYGQDGTGEPPEFGRPTLRKAWKAVREVLAETALRAETPAPREPKLTISDLDEILGGYDSAHVTRGTVLQRLNEWLRIRAAGEPEQAK